LWDTSDPGSSQPTFRRYGNIDEELVQLGKFHGHVGPYVILGYRAGKIANRVLGDDPFGKTALSFTGTKPSVSCFTDGVQFSSGCTLGKGNITVEEKGEARVIFTDKEGRAVEVTLLPGMPDRIRKVFDDGEHDAFNEWAWTADEEELFTVEIR